MEMLILVLQIVGCIAQLICGYGLIWIGVVGLEMLSRMLDEKDLLHYEYYQK